MTTYKLEIQKKFGNLYKQFYVSNQKPALAIEKTKPYETIAELLQEFDKELKEIQFDPDNDSIIWRGIAYSDLSTLKRLIRDGQF